MSYMRILIIVFMFVFGNAAMARSSLYETGTIKSVDVENNTFTVELDKSGTTETYSFPDTINFIDEGVALVDKSAFKPGQPVKLNFESTKPKSFAPGIKVKKSEYTLKGMIVR